MTKEYINPTGLFSPKAYYSHVIRAGNTIYIAGQAGFDKNGKIVGKGDVLAQAEQLYKNMKTCVEAAGGSMSDIVELHQFFKTFEDYRKFTASNIRPKYFGDKFPVSLGVVVSEFLDPDILIEVSAVAVLD